MIAPTRFGGALDWPAVTVADQARSARTASVELARATRSLKDAGLYAMADALDKAETAVLEANAIDVARAESGGTSPALIDRLRLGPDRIAGMAEGLRALAALPDPVGDVVRGWTNGNGVQVAQVRVPFGVVGIIYEARPNVTADAAGICLKSGNAVLLRGSSSAADSTPLWSRRSRPDWPTRTARRRRPAGAGSPRGDGGADGGARSGRRADPARWRRPDRDSGAGQPGSGDRDRRGQLPPLRRRQRRRADGAGHPAQRQGAAALGLQRHRDPAGARGPGADLPAQGAAGARAGGSDGARRRAGERVRGRGDGARRPTSRPSTCPWTSRRRSSTRWTARCTTSAATAPGTARRS